MRYSQVQVEKTNFLDLSGSAHPMGLLPAWKWVTRIHNGLISETCTCIHLYQSIKICIRFYFFLFYRVAWTMWQGLYLLHRLAYMFTCLCFLYAVFFFYTFFLSKRENKTKTSSATLNVSIRGPGCAVLKGYDPEQPMNVYLAACERGYVSVT